MRGKNLIYINRLEGEGSKPYYKEDAPVKHEDPNKYEIVEDKFQMLIPHEILAHIGSKNKKVNSVEVGHVCSYEFLSRPSVFQQ